MIVTRRCDFLIKQTSREMRKFICTSRDDMMREMLIVKKLIQKKTNFNTSNVLNS